MSRGFCCLRTGRCRPDGNHPGAIDHRPLPGALAHFLFRQRSQRSLQRRFLHRFGRLDRTRPLVARGSGGARSSHRPCDNDILGDPRDQSQRSQAGMDDDHFWKDASAFNPTPTGTVLALDGTQSTLMRLRAAAALADNDNVVVREFPINRSLDLSFAHPGSARGRFGGQAKVITSGTSRPCLFLPRMRWVRTERRVSVVSRRVRRRRNQFNPGAAQLVFQALSNPLARAHWVADLLRL